MSNEVITGFVSKIFEKSFPRKNGKGTGTAYSFKVETKEGQELNPFFRNGFNKPDFKEGDYVRFEVSDHTDNAATVVAGSLKVSKNPPGRSAQAAPAAGAGQSAPSKGGGYYGKTDKATQDRIQYQNARSAALVAVQALLSHNALPGTKADTKAGVAARYDELVDIIDKLTVRFFRDTETLRRLETVADDLPAESVAEKLPDEEEFGAEDGVEKGGEDDDFE